MERRYGETLWRDVGAATEPKLEQAAVLRQLKRHLRRTMLREREFCVGKVMEMHRVRSWKTCNRLNDPPMLVTLLVSCHNAAKQLRRLLPIRVGTRGELFLIEIMT